MSKREKIAALAKICVKKPKTLVKGAKYFWKYGYSGFMNNARARANAETEESNSNSLQIDDRVSVATEYETMFTIVMNIDDSCDVRHLKESIQSALKQNMNNAELLIIDNFVSRSDIQNVLKDIKDQCEQKRLDNQLKREEKKKKEASMTPEELAAVRSMETPVGDPALCIEHGVEERVEIIHLDKSISQCEAYNIAVEKYAKGRYLIFLNTDDYLSEYALLAIYGTLDNHRVRLVYGDHAYFNQSEAASEPFVKPDWSPDLFLSCPEYIMDVYSCSRDLFLEANGFENMPYQMAAEQLFLNMLKKVDRVGHADKTILIKRNRSDEPEMLDFRLALRKEYLEFKYPKGYARINKDEMTDGFDVRYSMQNNVLISIIIPTKDHADDLKVAIDSIVEKTLYKNYEIIVLNNNSEKEETFSYFDEVQKQYEFVKVLDASYEFNWSKLNNHGIREAKGEVYVVLNNDVQIISGEWLERLAEKALRPETGIVGGMLLFFDNTIQHAGVVLGMKEWAAHVYSGETPQKVCTPFVSPLYSRNVMACTGACYAVSKNVIEQIGGFDERFIICGSDIELCVRAYKNGLYNVYDPKILLYHYESKSRDSYIPEVDFKMSEIGYAPYRLQGDPFYNPNLLSSETSPKINQGRYLFAYGINVINAYISEIRPYTFRKSTFQEKRLNIIVPTINPKYVYAGISTALKFFERLAEETGYAKRIILCEAKEDNEAIALYKDRYAFVEAKHESNSRNQIVAYNDREKVSLSVSENDIFIFTAWWTAYTIQEAYMDDTRNAGLVPKQSIYLIQDYEPGFYPWSSRYLLAESTYHPKIPQIAVFNSGWLKDFFVQKGYQFDNMLVFDATFNSVLRDYRNKIGNHLKKDKIILLYGRPGVARNAFELLAEALEKWAKMQPDAKEWKILSAGESHDDVILRNCGAMIHSVGKLTIEEYARLLEKSYAGISLMVSPHPSYPPLEMATYGVKVITNVYENKDLKVFSDSIVSLKDVSALNIALELKKICDGYSSEVDVTVNEAYCNNQNEFQCMPELFELLEKC